MAPDGTIEPGDLDQALYELLRVETWEEFRRVIAAHPDLLEPAVDQVLGRLGGSESGQPGLVGTIAVTRYALSRCVLIGADLAMQEFLSAAPADLPEGQHSMRLSLDHVNRHTGETHDARPDLMAAVYGVVRQFAEMAGDDDHQAVVAWDAGLCLHVLPEGDRQLNLEAAVWSFCFYLDSSLAARMDDSYPRSVLAGALEDLAVASRSDRPPADPAQWARMCSVVERIVPGSQAAVQVLRAAGAMHHEDRGVRATGLSDAEALLTAVLDGPEEPPAAVAAAALNKLGEVRRLDPRRQVGEATELFRSVETMFSQNFPGDGIPDLLSLHITSSTNLAVALAAGGDSRDLEEAARLLERNLAALSPQESPYEWIRACLVLGDLHASVDDIAAALASYQHAADALGEGAPHDASPEIESRFGSVFLWRHDFRRAANAYDGAAGVWTREECPERWAEMCEKSARASYSRETTTQRSPGAWQAAATSLVAELEAILDIDDPTRDSARQTYWTIGDILMSLGSWERAANAYAAAIDAATCILARQIGRVAQRVEAGPLDELHRRWARCLVDLDRPFEAARALDGGRTRLLVRHVLPWPPSPVSRVRWLRRRSVFVRHHEPNPLSNLSRGDTIAFTHAKLILGEVGHERSIGFETPGRRTEAELSRVKRTAGRDVAHILRKAPAVQALWDVPPLTDEDILACVPKEGALVVPIVGPDDTVVLVVPAGVDALGPEHIVRAKLDENEIHHLLAGSSETFLGWLRAYSDRPRVFAANDEHELAGELWAHILENNGSLVWDYIIGAVTERLERLAVPRGAHVAFVVDGPLAMLPLHTAWSREDARRQPFADRYAVSYAPSVRLLREQTHRARHRRPPRLLLVADPTDDLEHARAEAAAVERAFPGTVTALPAAAATPKRVKKELRGHTYTHLHLACHAEYRVEDPMSSSVLLAGEEEFAARELLVECAPLDLQLVVLSACETALTDVDDVPGEPSSLLSTFVEVGASAVVGTLWEVEDVSSMLVVERFYAERARGVNVPQALRRAQLAIRTTTAETLTRRFATGAPGMPAEVATRQHERFSAMDPQSCPFEEPFFWAPFICTTGVMS